jgi:hypothetical protein
MTGPMMVRSWSRHGEGGALIPLVPEPDSNGDRVVPLAILVGSVLKQTQLVAAAGNHGASPMRSSG